MSLPLALVAVLCSSGVPSVSDLVEGHHSHHSSLGGSSSSLELDPGWLLDDDGLPWVAVELLSRADLRLHIDGLRARVPGMGGVAALITSGVILVLVGVGFSIGGLVQTLLTGIFAWTLGVGLGALGLGILLIVLGAVDLVWVGNTRLRYEHRLRELEARLQVLDKLTLEGPKPAFMLARF